MSDLRAEIDQLIASGDATGAHALLGQLWREAPGMASAGFVLAKLEKIGPAKGAVKRRLAILRSFTVEPLVPLLRAAAAVQGLDLIVDVLEFNGYAQEMLDPRSRLYEVKPDLVILAVQARDLAPDLWAGFRDLGPREVEAAVGRVERDLRSWIDAFRAASAAHLIVHNLEVPAHPAQGIYDGRAESSQVEALRRVNGGLGRVARGTNGVYLLDYDGLVARHGRLGWHDEAKWLAMRMPIAAAQHVHLVNEWLRHLLPLAGRICKVLVTDLDNTLWGGVIGEDGPDGIQLGVEYPGAAFQEVQRALLDLHKRGVLLAISSKNNPADALAVLERHPEMLLRPSHFAAMRIGWGDKAQALRELAEELRLGLDSLAFLDDNPTERQWVRSQLPEVAVIELPRDPFAYARAVRECPLFERLSLSTEDAERSGYYAADRLRDDLRKGADSVEGFLRTLEMEADIARVDGKTLARVAQLTQKTNQFNLTTRRYNEQQVADLIADPACRVLRMRLRDRFGDHGIVGVAITRTQGRRCEVDTFLLSCRVIGRTAETALLATVSEVARRAGAEELFGWFYATPKNDPARAFYGAHGFASVEETTAGVRWSLDLARKEIASPEWIRCTVDLGST